MAKNPDKRASPSDLAEFGDHELSGAPSIAALIAALPTDELREAYRNERRAAIADICARQGRPLCTWREYFAESNMTLDEFDARYAERRFALSYRRALGEALTPAEESEIDWIDRTSDALATSSSEAPPASATDALRPATS